MPGHLIIIFKLLIFMSLQPIFADTLKQTQRVQFSVAHAKSADPDTQTGQAG